MVQKQMQVMTKCKFEVMKELKSQWRPDVPTLAGHQRAQQIVNEQNMKVVDMQSTDRGVRSASRPLG
jgi:hypothetical protein